MANTFKNAHGVTGNAATDLVVYTTPSSTTTVILGMSICNVTTGTVSATVSFKDGGSTVRKHLHNVQIPAGSTLEVLAGQKYILETTDTLCVQSDTATSLNVILGVMEIN
jgi:hypothetical protein